MVKKRAGSPKPTIKIPRDVERYLKMIESDKPKACKDQHKLAALVRKAFATGDIYVDTKQYNAYINIGKAMFPTLFPWQKFLCCFRSRNLFLLRGTVHFSEWFPICRSITASRFL